MDQHVGSSTAGDLMAHREESQEEKTNQNHLHMVKWCCQKENKRNTKSQGHRESDTPETAFCSETFGSSKTGG